MKSKLIYWFFKNFYKYLRRYETIILRGNKNIILGKGVKISPDVQIETRFGGVITIGEKTEIVDGAKVLTYKGNITIGKYCSINAYTVIYGHGNTVIGDNVLIAGHCMVIPNNHGFMRTDVPISSQPNVSKGITIEDNVWIGHGCSILDGVVIGRDSIVAAGSVVTKTVPPFSIVAGIPARIIKRRDSI